MTRTSIASWNINSVRARIGIVEKFLREEAPDILCLQETKVECGLFPPEMFRRLGYEHIVTHGQRMHHGVAIVSKLPLTEVRKYDWQANGEARHVGVTLPSDRKSTRLTQSLMRISYAVFCLKKKKKRMTN